MADQKDVMVKMALLAWDNYVKRTDDLFNSLSDEQLLREIAPGKNTGAYLLGHLIAVNDTMVSLFGLGERAFASLDQAFVEQPDKSGLPMPCLPELRNAWKTQKELLGRYFASLDAAAWFQKHSLMTDEDALREPHRNKLSVLLNRTNHLAWHYGQLLLLKD